MKILAKTTGSFLLRDPQTNDMIEAHRPSVVRSSTFFQERIAIGQVEILIPKLADDATDAEFQALWMKRGDKAIAEFSDMFGPQPIIEPAKDTSKK